MQVRLAFRSGTAGFAIGTRRIAGRTFATGRLATLGARLTLGTRTFTGRVAAGGIFTTRAVTGPLTVAAGFAITGTICIGRPLSVTRRIGFGAALTVARGTFRARAIAGTLTIAGTIGIGWPLSVARRAGRRIESFGGTISFTAGFAIARTVGVAGTFSVAGSTRRRGEPITRGITGRTETAFAVTRCAGRATAFAAHAAGREQLVHGQLAVVILVERPQRIRRTRDFILGDEAVAVLVESGDERRRRRPFTATGFAGRDWGTLPVFTGGYGRAALRLLGIRKARRQGERECDDGCSVFHGVGFCLFSLLFAFSDCWAAVDSRTQGLAESSDENCEVSVNAPFRGSGRSGMIRRRDSNSKNRPPSCIHPEAILPMNLSHLPSRTRSGHVAVLFAGAFLGCAFAGAADALQSKSTYSKAYGETKGVVAVDPAKDLPRYPAVEPKGAVATWKVKPGFRLKLAAHEPQVRSPIAVSFDERGRMFVVEMIDYSELRDVTPHLGRVSMLEDKDGDGYYETSTVFADNLPWPTGLICANGGIYVIATPDVYFFKDTRGAGKADVREVVFTGFGSGLKLLNVQGLANCPQWGLDNRIHIQAGGGNRGVVTCLKRPDLKGVELGGKDFWFDPRTHEFGLEAGGAQFGMSFDDYGRKFACSNSDHLQYFVYDDRYAARNPFFSMPSPRQSIAADGGAAEVYRISPDEPWRIVRTRWRIAGVVKGMVEGGGRVSGYFTGATGTTVYRGDAYGDDFLNNTFTGDAGGQLVHRKKIYPDGVSLIGKRPDDEQNFEFAASKDTWVRVVNFANAPDGCLHVIDMYREVIEHPWSIPDEIKKHIDLNSGNDRGRIYRIEPERTDWQRRAGVDLSKASAAELVKTLEHPNGWQRDTAARLLYEKQDKSAIPLLEKIVNESPSTVAKLHALGALDGLGALNEQIVIGATTDKSEHVRERAVKLLERFITEGQLEYRIWDKIRRLVRDPSLRVQMQIAFLIGEFQKLKMKDEDATVVMGSESAYWFPSQALRYLATRNDSDAMLRAAVFSSFTGSLRWMITDEFKHPRTYSSPSAERYVVQLASMAGASNDRESIQAIIDALGQASGTKIAPALATACIRALAEGLKRAGSTIAKADADSKLAAVFAKAADTVRNEKAAEAARIEAVQLVSLDTPKQAVPALLVCLGKSQPEAVQSAGVAALGQFGGGDVTDAFIAHWPDLSKKARTAAFAVMLARPERATALLNAIGAKSIAVGELSASDVQALFKHKDASVAKLADKVLAELKPPSREEAVAKYKAALAAKGDASRGREIYAQRCISCHRVGGEGFQLGPDLITVKAKGRDGILTAILEPNKEVAPQFISYTVNTKDGQSLMGFIAKDDASGLTLKMIGGAEQTIPRNQIKGSSSSGLSLMPEGIEAGMNVQAMADLLTFIEELK
jgi:putative membrane-bound dehydrogenase-like protein